MDVGELVSWMIAGVGFEVIRTSAYTGDISTGVQIAGDVVWNKVAFQDVMIVYAGVSDHLEYTTYNWWAYDSVTTVRG